MAGYTDNTSGKEWITPGVGQTPTRRRRRIIIIDEYDEVYPADAGYSTYEPCAHQNCTECFGTGRKANGAICLHYLVCYCRRCSPHSLVFWK